MVDKVVRGIGFSPSTLVSVSIIPLISPTQSFIYMLLLPKDKWAKPGNFSKSRALSERERWVGKYFHFFCASKG
jgi:hypothetical protein